MSSYEIKQASKKARYAEIARKLEARAEQLYKLDCQQMDQIPAGQPILVGHHSESRHRAAIARSHSRINRILELNKKSEYYRQKALTESRSISSDDGDKEILKKHMQQYPSQKSPCPSYQVTNTNAEIRRIKQRIAELEKAKKEPAKEAIKGKGFNVIESKEDNRILFKFDEKPNQAICQIMRQHGFKWSPSRRVWVCMLNHAGRCQVQAAINAINSLTLNQ